MEHLVFCTVIFFKPQKSILKPSKNQETHNSHNYHNSFHKNNIFQEPGFSRGFTPTYLGPLRECSIGRTLTCHPIQPAAPVLSMSNSAPHWRPKWPRILTICWTSGLLNSMKHALNIEQKWISMDFLHYFALFVMFISFLAGFAPICTLVRLRRACW